MSLTERLAIYLKARESEWIDGRELATVAGAYGWRSRVADARREFSMTIENRVLRVTRDDGASWFKVSQYRYVPVETVSNKGMV